MKSCQYVTQAGYKCIWLHPNYLTKLSVSESLDVNIAIRREHLGSCYMSDFPSIYHFSAAKCQLYETVASYDILYKPWLRISEHTEILRKKIL